MTRFVSKLLTFGLLCLFTGSLFLNIAPRNCLALDPFEPNNTLASATVLHKENYTGLSLYPNDNDYYCVFLEAGENMSVVVWNYTVTPEFYLFKSSGSSSYSSVIEGSTRKVLVLPVVETGYYYFQIRSGSGTDYCLNITDIVPIGIDEYEPNDNFESATEVFVGETYSNLSLWDVDYFKVDLAAGTNLSITMNRTGGSNNHLIAELYAPNNSSVLDSIAFDANCLNAELILANASEAGTYFLKVSYELGAWGNYSISIQRTGDDCYEPNDNFMTATPLDINVQYSDLCLHDDDYYNVSLTAGDDVVLFILPTGLQGYFRITLFGPGQTPLYSGITEYYPYTFRGLINVPTTGNYTLKINATADGWCNYNLTFFSLLDDIYDISGTNDAFVDATPIAKHASNGMLAYLDDDFYNVTLAAGDNLSIYVQTFSTLSSGRLYVTLYAIDQTTVISSCSISTGSTGEIALLSAPAPGGYYIRVNGTADTWGNYTLVARDIYDDSYEDNDAFETAPFLAKGISYANFALLDDDFFNVTMAEGENLTVQLSRSSGSGSGTFNVSFIAPDQVTILQSVAIAAGYSGELVLTAAATAGTYHLRVHRSDDYTQNYLSNYSLSLRNFYDDLFEENDVLGTGPYVTKGTTYNNLALRDDDYYNISLQAGDNISIRVGRGSNVPGQFYIHLFDPDARLLQSQVVAYNSFYYSEDPLNPLTYVAEVFLPDVAVTGTYYLLVNKTADGAGNYSLTLRDLPDDPLEPDDTIGGAVAVSKGDYYRDLQLYDDDYYSILLPTSANLSIIVTRIIYDSVFNLYLLDTDGTSILQFLNMTGSLSGNLVAISLAGGTYFLKVNGTRGSFKNYTLTILDAFDDAFEVNNDVGSARELVNGSVYTDLYCRDADYYNVTLIAGGNFAATLYRAGGGGNLYLNLFSLEGSLLSTALVSDVTPKAIFLTNLSPGGNYTILVNASEGAWGHYSLALGGILDDAYEDNDDFTHAPALLFGKTYSNLQLCDTDFFSYEATAGETFNALLVGPSDTSVHFNFTVFAPDQVTVVCQGTYSYFTSSVIFSMYFIVSNAAGGTYYLKVNATTGVYAAYSLVIQTLQAETFTGNNDAEHALLIDPAQTEFWGYTLEGEDWFKFTLDSNSTIWMLYLCRDDAAGLSIDLLAGDGTTLLLLAPIPPSPLAPFNLLASYCYSTYMRADFYYRVRSAPGRAASYIFLSLCLNVSQPADITYYEGSTGNNITWSLLDTYFTTPYNTATIFRNGTPTPILELTWGLSRTITVSADGLPPGTYEYTLAVATYLGALRNDTVIVRVLPVFLTLWPAPDVSFVIGSPVTIEWGVSALHVGVTNYTLMEGGTLLTYGPWDSGSTISYTPLTLGVGTHMITMNVTDGLGNWTIDEVEMIVLNFLTITSPSDLTFTAGTTGNVLAWTPTVAQLVGGSPSYDILVDGIVVATGSWTNQTAITHVVDSLGVGNHVVSIIVRDGFGTTRQDEVAVTVVGGFPMEFAFIAVAAGVGIALGAVFFVRHRKRRAISPV